MLSKASPCYELVAHYVVLNLRMRLILLTTSSSIVVEDDDSASSVCVIKEPFFTKVARVGEEYIINVDHISDMFWLSNDDPRRPSVWTSQPAEEKQGNDLKVEGNSATKAGLNQKAADM